ncbi:MAG: LamG domain-containing protein [Planctomycetes bacterium]|nr:LamG domain-containing protein [Planctomycetota bacterium]
MNVRSIFFIRPYALLLCILALPSLNLLGSVRSTGNIHFTVNDNQLMVLEDTGLGVGITSPAANLHIAGNGIITTDLSIGGASLSSNLNISGTMQVAPYTFSDNGTISSHSFAFADSTSGDIYLDLPSSGVTGRVVTIKKISASNNVYISSTYPIDGKYIIAMEPSSTIYPFMSVVNDGSSWLILSETDTSSGSYSDNLILWWNCEGSDQFLDDVSPNDNYGSFRPSSSSHGASGNALYFDTNNYVTIPSSTSLEITDKVSFSFWVRRTSSAGTGMTLSKKSVWNAAEGWEVETTDTTIRVLGGGGDFATSNAVTWTNTWQHVVATVDQTIATTYLNNADVSGADSSVSSINTSSAQALFFGRRSGVDENNLNGEIDDVRIFNKVLSTSEVSSLYQMSDSVASSNLMGWWKFDSIGSGNIISNNSGQSNNGTLVPDQDTSAAPTLTIGQVGNSIDFDGGTARVTSGGIGISGNADRSVTCWVKVDDWSQRCGLWVMGKTYSDYQDYSLLVEATAGRYQFNGWNADFDFYLPSDNYGWHHIALCYESGTMHVYVDGAFLESNTLANALNTTDTGIVLGKWQNSGDYFDGQIDEFRLYDRALSLQEVNVLYESGR